MGSWQPPAGFRRLIAIDAHTEGEPLRVVFDGFPLSGDGTILDRRRKARAEHDDLRRSLMWEPRGHADMYGCLVGPPVTDEADIGVLFTHNEGFSTMCGHGIIGVTTVLVECGLIEASGDDVSVGIDTPAGFVRATAHLSEGRVARVSFVNVPSFVAGLDLEVEVDGLGRVGYDLAFGGAFYAYVSAADFGLDLVAGEYQRIIDLGRRIKRAVEKSEPPRHPLDEDLSFLYGTIFVGPGRTSGSHSRNVCVFADGEVDRCPTGTGVSGRLAIHHARGDLAEDEAISIESIIGSTFEGRVVSTATVGASRAIVPEVSGRAFITGRNELFIDPADPLPSGFLLR